MFVSVHVQQQEMELRFNLISHLWGDLTRLSKWRYLSGMDHYMVNEAEKRYILY